jgi:hypothetical protein
MTDSNYTHIAVLLDRSGSMSAIKSDTEGGFKTFLDEQKRQPGKATLSLSQFDTVYDVVYGPRDIQTAPDLVLSPRGGTALLDGMGRCITETGEFLAGLPEAERPGNVIFVTITDGEENSSHEWTRERVFAEVKKQQEQYGWTFIFLAANQDAIQAGAQYGVNSGTSLTYDSHNVGGTYASLSASITRSRSGGVADFSQAERAASSSTPV